MEGIANQLPSQSFVFGQWVLQEDGLLLRDGTGLHLPPKELHVLRLLLRAAGSLVLKNWLLDQVWPGCDVADESLTRCIYTLRKLLGRENDYIKTVYGKGYRFVGEVVERATLPPSCSSMLSLSAECDLEMQCEVIRRLSAVFGGRLCVMTPESITDTQVSGGDLSRVERIMPDDYLGARCLAEVGEWQSSSRILIACSKCSS